MKTETFEAVAEQAYQRKLPTPIKYAGSFTAYENIGEVKAANDFPNDDEVVAIRNGQRKAAARAAAWSKALEDNGIAKPTLETDEQMRLREMYKIFRASGKSHDEARNLASSALGLVWEDEQ